MIQKIVGKSSNTVEGILRRVTDSHIDRKHFEEHLWKLKRGGSPGKNILGTIIASEKHKSVSQKQVPLQDILNLYIKVLKEDCVQNIGYCTSSADFAYSIYDKELVGFTSFRSYHPVTSTRKENSAHTKQAIR